MSDRPRQFVTHPGGGVGGEIGVPGDKSISHRAALLGAIAEGVTEIRGYLEAEDCLATLEAIAATGIRVERGARGLLQIHGAGLRGLSAPRAALDLGNSGTSMRLLTGVLAGQTFDSVLVGDESLMRRPMERVATPLRRMGADVQTSDGRPPIVIRGRRQLSGCEHVLAVPSAQVKSALLLAGLQATGRTIVREPAASRDHTERMLPAFGVPVIPGGDAVAVDGPARLAATSIDIPGDFSSAAYFIAAGLIAGTKPLLIRGVGVNPTRTALLDILRQMGGDIRVHPIASAAGEPRADIEVHPGTLHGINVPENRVPIAMDELPVLFAVAAVAEGKTLVTGAGELRVKESDRLAAMAAGLEAVGTIVDRLPDGLCVHGGPVRGGVVESQGDHRVAMAFAVLGARADGTIAIRDVQNVATSFPGFAQTVRAAGLLVAEE
ncbi:MAG TPA: 3-phosphoshikimate 1-carboxyvinyltransferase [Steroidobacteraceae bacterium]|nr:3-phosphoshikimate 1-carboxyvinyltransferase [Steroidobacteraceae bacterium]